MIKMRFFSRIRYLNKCCIFLKKIKKIFRRFENIIYRTRFVKIKFPIDEKKILLIFFFVVDFVPHPSPWFIDYRIFMSHNYQFWLSVRRDVWGTVRAALPPTGKKMENGICNLGIFYSGDLVV